MSKKSMLFLSSHLHTSQFMRSVFDKDTFDEVGYKRLKYILHHFIWTTEHTRLKQREAKIFETYGFSNKSLDLEKNADIHATLFFFEMFVAACSFETSRHMVVSCLASRAEQTLSNESHKHIYMVFGECYNLYKNYWVYVIKTDVDLFVILASFECYLQETSERMQKHAGSITTAYNDNKRGGSQSKDVVSFSMMTSFNCFITLD